MASKRKNLNDPDSYVLKLKKERLCDTEDVQCEMNKFTNFEQPIELVAQVDVKSENDPLAPVYQDKTLGISQETHEEVISTGNRQIEQYEETVEGKYEMKPFEIKSEPGDAFSTHSELDIKYEPIYENCDDCVGATDSEHVRTEDNMAGTSEVILDPATGLFVPKNPEIDNDSQAEGSDGGGSSTDTADSPGPSIETHSLQPTIVKPSTSNMTPMTPQMSSPVTVRMLLAHPFSSDFWTADQRNEILAQNNVLSLYVGYRFPWLCDSPELERFFCWPCLLFSTASHVWSVTASSCRNCGYNCSCNKDFEEALANHQASVEHQNAQLQCDYQKKKALISIKGRNVFAFYEHWKRLVKTICCERKDNTRKNKSLFEGNLKFTEKIQDLIRPISKEQASSNESIKLAEKILFAAGNYLKVSVVEEVKNAQYVTLHVQDLSAVVADKTWAVVIARYADQNGCINETVIDFVRMHLAVKYRSAAEAIKLLKHLFIDAKLGNNVVGFSYSASIVVPSDVPAFHRGILEWCPNALFYHSPCESLQVSLFQAITHVTACRKYFQDAQELCDFMNEHRSLIRAKESIVSKSEGCNTVLPKKFDGDFSSKLSLHYATLLKIFENIVKSKSKDMRSTVAEAKRFHHFLKNRKNHISIVIISEIFSIVSGLADAVQKPFDLDLLMQHRINAIRTLTFMIKTGPKIIEQLTCNKILRKAAAEKNQAYVILFHYIIDTAVSFLTHRFENLEQFNYTSSNLVDSTLKLAKYPAHSWDFIKRARLDQKELHQIKYLIDSESFENKSLTELLNFVQHTDKDDHRGLHKYLLFVHTISLAETGQQRLIKSVLKFVNEVPTKNQTANYVHGCFWQMDDQVFKKILEGPELYQKILDACKLKIVVENECNVKLAAHASYFS